MIFVTSGSMLPFDRLFRVIDDAVASGIIVDEVFGQIGESRYKPKNYAFTRFLEKEQFDKRVQEASLVIAHAGIGVIMQALESKTPLLVLPRRAELGEHVNDHQVSTAEKFESLGHVVAFEEQTLQDKLQKVQSFVPKPRSPNVAGVGARVADFLGRISSDRD